MTTPPPDAFQKGKRLQVGSHETSIIKYISSGGFAHVYTCTINPPFHGNTTACLKRVVVPNKLQLTLLRQEVDAMKRLRGNKHIVSYIDSHASRLPTVNAGEQQQYEVLLLMEYCSNKGLIDFMNTRLTHRLTEPEVLTIMAQITTGVAMCHHLRPPLLHRDIKIENVLIDKDGTYKLCDFGSAVPFAPVPQSPQELAALHDDIMHHTTPQYRAPEMIDLSQGFPIDDKSDIWALGIFLYKVCYYTTPFESPHQKTMADLEKSILNCHVNLRFPGSPQYSPRLQNVIKCCLRADPRRRPNALQLLQEVCSMQGVKQIPETVPYSVRMAKTVPINYDYTSVTNDSSTQTQVLKATASVPSKPVKVDKGDVFASIDKSKILAMGGKKPDLPSRPFSRSNNSSATLHDIIKKQVDESSHEINDLRKSEDADRGTLEFLKSREEEGVNSRQSTGGSIKASLKKGLRRISTGGSISSQKSGSSEYKRRSSATSLRRLLSGSKKPEEPQKENNHLRVPSQEKKVSSIQKRMSLLLSNAEHRAPKTASGYGKYTDQDDISAINFTDLSASVSTDSLQTNESSSMEDLVSSPPQDVFKSKSSTSLNPPKSRQRKYSSPPPVPPSLRNKNPQANAGKKSTSPEKVSVAPSKSQTISKAKTDTEVLRQKQKLAAAAKSKKAPPPRPTKPKHLAVASSRRVSTSSDTSMPDLDDLEKSFAKRFPSYV